MDMNKTSNNHHQAKKLRLPFQALALAAGLCFSGLALAQWPSYRVYAGQQVVNTAYLGAVAQHYSPPVPTQTNAWGLVNVGYHTYRAGQNAVFAYGAAQTGVFAPVSVHYAGRVAYHSYEAWDNSRGYANQYGGQINQPIPQPYFNPNWYPR